MLVHNRRRLPLSQWWRRLLGNSKPALENVAPRTADVVTPAPQEPLAEQVATEDEALFSEALARSSKSERPTAVSPLQADPIESTQLRLDSGARRTERIAPLTRRRLRRHASITWPATVDPDALHLDEVERLHVLREIVEGGSYTNRGAILGEALARAYLEEDGERRTLALRGLVQGNFTEGPSIFREVLRSGNDAERSLAIDGLAAQRRLDDLVPAFEDRIEALAAKAALAAAGTSSRAAVRNTLRPHVSESRAESILALLVGLRD